MRRLVIAFALVGATRAVSAQQTEEFSADRETAAQLERILISARDKGLPTEPIVTKARQGTLMHAPSPRIVAAAQAMSRRLEEAKDVLAPSPTTNDIVAGQDALSVPGVTKDMLHAIRLQRPTRPVGVALGVLAQLVASGIKPASASEIVTDLVRQQATDALLMSFANDVNKDISEGIAATASLNVRYNGLKPLLAHIQAPQATQGIIMTAPGVPTGPPKPRP